MPLSLSALREVRPEQLSRWLEAGGCRLVDVREADEFRRERIAGAESRPLGAIDPDALRATDDRPLVLQCNSGARSREAAERLLAAGWQEVWHLAGGLQAWKRAGLPVEGDHRAPLPLMRQVQITAGALIVIGFALGVMVAPVWHVLSAFIGAGLVFAGVSGTCGMAALLARLPWNRVRTGAPAAAARPH
jgi:rhodanese-related sulfurtransferase